MQSGNEEVAFKCLKVTVPLHNYKKLSRDPKVKWDSNNIGRELEITLESIQGDSYGIMNL
jgi:hypothetical protein